MSSPETKPPTPGEIEGAREWFKDCVSLTAVSRIELDVLLAALDAETAEKEARFDCHAGPGTTEPACGGCTTCLTRALDAAEARATALRSDVWRVMPTEDGDGGEKWRAFAADRDMAASSAEARATAAEKIIDRAREFADARGLARGLGGHYGLREVIEDQMERAETAERERDEARAALKPFAEYAKTRDASPMLGLSDVIHAIHVKSGRAEITLTDCRAAAAALAKEAPRG